MTPTNHNNEAEILNKDLTQVMDCFGWRQQGDSDLERDLMPRL
jgi:RIO-like serine/threonine protein kinase